MFWFAVEGDGNKVYGEVDGFELLCSYKTSDAGGCKVLLHPSWASAVYPASIFSTAPIDLVLEIIKDDSFQPLQKMKNYVVKNWKGTIDDILQFCLNSFLIYIRIIPV